MQAYLNTKTGQYFESSTGQPRSLDWIEIPAGATFATGKNNNPIFRKDGYYWGDASPLCSSSSWRNTSVTLSNAEACGLDVVWVCEEPSMNEIIKTAEDYRQQEHRAVPRDPTNPHSDYMMAPELTDFGTGILSVSSDTVYHFYACPHNPSWPPVDGIIVFDGRISGAEDYDRLCIMIAEHINRKPDDFSIRSLTIVG